MRAFYLRREAAKRVPNSDFLYVPSRVKINIGHTLITIASNLPKSAFYPYHPPLIISTTTLSISFVTRKIMMHIDVTNCFVISIRNVLQLPTLTQLLVHKSGLLIHARCILSCPNYLILIFTVLMMDLKIFI